VLPISPRPLPLPPKAQELEHGEVPLHEKLKIPSPLRERLLDDDRIVGLRALQSIPKVVSTGDGDPKDWKAYASCLPRLTWLLSGLDEGRLAGERCREAVEESSYLQSRLEPKHPESDCARSMLASLFPSQDCIRLAPSPATSRSPTGEVLPNEMLPPSYVSSLASIRRRIVSAPRPTTARLLFPLVPPLQPRSISIPYYNAGRRAQIFTCVPCRVSLTACPLAIVVQAAGWRRGHRSSTAVPGV
jgi:hypothetical protein